MPTMRTASGSTNGNKPKLYVPNDFGFVCIFSAAGIHENGVAFCVTIVVKLEGSYECQDESRVNVVM